MPSLPAHLHATTQRAAAPPARPRSPKGLRLGRRVAEKSLVEFTRAFAVMLRARLPLLQALQTAALQTSDRPLKALLEDVTRHVQQGQSLSQALARHERVFTPLYVQLVRVGEFTGLLDEVLLRLATYLEKASALRRKLRMALVYPSVVLGIALSAVAFLLTFIVPTFAEMFADFGAELPAPTRIILHVSDFLTGHALGILAGLALLYGLVRTWVNTPNGRAWRDGAMLRVPGLGVLLVKSLVARFCRTLGTLLESGVVLTDALELLGHAAGNTRLEAHVQDMLGHVRRGGALTAPLRAGSLFPPMVVQMIAAGEETAELDQMLLHVAAHYEDDLDTVVESLTALIEPVLIVVIGALLGGILIAMYLPMFEMIGIAG